MLHAPRHVCRVTYPALVPSFQSHAHVQILSLGVHVINLVLNLCIEVLAPWFTFKVGGEGQVSSVAIKWDRFPAVITNLTLQKLFLSASVSSAIKWK